MKKIIIEVNEIEVEALTSVLVGALSQYKTLSENNPEALRQISIATKLISQILEEYSKEGMNEKSVSIETFKSSVDNISQFLKDMRTQGYLGLKPQSDEVEKVSEMAFELTKLQHFVINSYEKNKDFIIESNWDKYE